VRVHSADLEQRVAQHAAMRVQLQSWMVVVYECGCGKVRAGAVTAT
jgi:hypothetical protein